MASYTNERGQVVYNDNGEDVGIARSQGDCATHKEGHGLLHKMKEGVKEGVHDVAEGMGKLADKITNNPEHDHLSSKVTVVKE